MKPIDATRATAEAMPAEPSILSLYRAWDAEYERLNRKGSGFTSEQMKVLCKHHSTMTDQICSLDSQSPLDVLAKIIAASVRMEECIAYEWADSIRDEALAMLAAESEPDPLIDAIKAYREGMAAFTTIKERDWPSYGGEDAVIQKTYGAPLNALNEWDQPAL